MNKEEKTQIAQKVAEKINGNVWTGGDNVRVYTRGYIIIDNNGGCCIDNVKGNMFDDVKDALNDLNIKYYR